ncbi:hypothetical protein GGR50DRAFT_423051 [Xylaria sp. CBS 124048]|nr:hypothetical protein GGR50DRAFT_423051 [Xylaria sp. CBS 124048]
MSLTQLKSVLCTGTLLLLFLSATTVSATTVSAVCVGHVMQLVSSRIRGIKHLPENMPDKKKMKKKEIKRGPRHIRLKNKGNPAQSQGRIRKGQNHHRGRNKHQKVQETRYYLAAALEVEALSCDEAGTCEISIEPWSVNKFTWDTPPSSILSFSPVGGIQDVSILPPRMKKKKKGR